MGIWEDEDGSMGTWADGTWEDEDGNMGIWADGNMGRWEYGKMKMGTWGYRDQLEMHNREHLVTVVVI
jgi:hypothetical protein